MKRNLLKVIGISFLVFFVISWVIPIGTYSGGKLTTTSIDPVGLIDLVNTPVSALVTFALYAVVFSVIGGFYGVIEDAGILEKVSNKWALKFEGKEKSFLVISIIFFALLSSLTGLIIPLFILVPLFAAAIFKMNFDKVTALASTVGAILVGSIGSTYGFNITGYTKNLLSLDMNNHIWARVIILILLTVLLCVTVVFSSKKKEKKNINDSKKSKNEEVKAEVKEAKKAPAKKQIKAKSNKKTTKTAKKTTKKSNTKAAAILEPIKKIEKVDSVNTIPFWILFILMLIIAFIGMYNWYYSFNIDVFNKMHEAVMGVKISKFKIFENLFSGASQFGYWSNIEFTGIVVFTTVIIAWIYKLGLNRGIESFIRGIKKWLPTAIYVTLANVILVVLYQAMQGGQGTLVDTINGTLFKLADGFNPVLTGVCAFISSFFFNDLYYLLADMSSFTSSFDASSLSVAGVLIQSVYAAAMLILPTSTLLVAGLSAFDVSYGKWFKYIWRFTLISFLLVLLVCGILTLI